MCSPESGPPEYDSTLEKDGVTTCFVQRPLWAGLVITILDRAGAGVDAGETSIFALKQVSNRNRAARMAVNLLSR
jgi:hypothetical protein